MSNESTFCFILSDLHHIIILARKYSQTQLKQHERDWIFCVTRNECHYS